MESRRIAVPEPSEAHVWRIELPATGGREAARSATGEILARYLGERPVRAAASGREAGAFAIVVAERGKPRLVGSPPPLTFNLSHSGGLALVAVAAGGVEVGVDVERLRPRRDLVRLAERWLPPGDAAAVAAAPDEGREETFYAAWTCHEARTKCTGAGLGGPPPGADVVATALKIDAGYAAAIAWSGAAPAAHGPPIFVRRLEFAAPPRRPRSG
jgi:phosphopantetheinyl transferase